MTPEEIAAIIEQHKFPTLHAGDTGINVITLQIWLRMLSFYQGPITGLLDAATAQAVEAFRAAQRAAVVPLTAPPGTVLDRDTWEAMDNLLQQRLPPDPDALDRLPLPRRSSYDSDEKYQKALYEGLRVFGFPIEPAAAPIRIPIAVDASGLGAMHGVPPGSYELEIDRVGKPAEGSVELHLEDGDGVPLQGHLRLVQGGVERSVIVADGQAQVAGLAPGEYEVVIDRVDATTRILEDTGSLAIHLVDAHDKPIGGSGYLVGETGEIASIQQAVKLFKALYRGLDSGLETDERSGLGSNFLTGRFDDTAHHYHSRAWQSFNSTWGRFYGAPWMGIVFHSDHTPQGSVPGELNWGTFQTIRMLQQWGAAYLQASTDEQDVRNRLQRPIAVRYIARPLGGQIDRRNDFSQTGTEASLHPQRLSPQVVAGIPAGQYYGGIDYRSPEYSSDQMQRQLAVLVSLDQRFHALTPDDGLVERLVAPDLKPFVTNLTNDGFPASKSVNTIVFHRQLARRFKHLFIKTNKDQLMKAANAAWTTASDKALIERLAQAESNILDWKTLTVFYDQIMKSGGGAFNLKAQEHIKYIQKALWWCRLLVAAGKFDKAHEWSGRYLDMGYGGLFKDYESITPRNVTADLSFSFNDDDWKNPLQLESLVEFYINYNDPNRPAESFVSGESPEGISEPRLPTLTAESSYDAEGVTDGLSSGLHFVLIDCFGARNNTQGKQGTKRLKNLIKLPGAVDQFSVTLNTEETNSIGHDLGTHPESFVLWLPDDLNRASASYRIRSATLVSGNKYNLTLDGKPSVGNNTLGKILRSSSWLSGDNATSAGYTVTLDAALYQINPNMDTIYLSGDAARPSRVYRITSVINANTITLDGQPELDDNPSAWRIPAGVGGMHPPLEYELRNNREPLRNSLPEIDPNYVIGYDHYDGLLFVVYDGMIQNRFRFTSYTSRIRPRPLTAAQRRDELIRPPLNPHVVQALSIRGNRSYDVQSASATRNEYANFSFAVSDAQTRQRDSSRYYHAQSVGTSINLHTPDGVPNPPGANYDVFIHFGFQENPGTGSMACLVSPSFYKLRDKVLELLNEHHAISETLYSQFHGMERPVSEQLYVAAHTAPAGEAGQAMRTRLQNFMAAWSNSRIMGKLWLIRPDERPLADYSLVRITPQ